MAMTCQEFDRCSKSEILFQLRFYLMSTTHRKKYFIDFKVQGALLFRLVLHWMVFALATFGLLFCMDFLVLAPEYSIGDSLLRLWNRYSAMVLVSLFLLPVFAFDLLKMSSRFAGPVYRLRKAMQAVVRGDEVPSIRFRPDDYWHDLSDDFNAMLAMISQDQPKASDTQNQQNDPPVGSETNLEPMEIN